MGFYLENMISRYDPLDPEKYAENRNRTKKNHCGCFMIQNRFALKIITMKSAENYFSSLL